MTTNRSSGRETGYDRNRMFVEAVLLEDLDFGSLESPAMAEALTIDRVSPGVWSSGRTVTFVNRDPHFNRLADQHILGISLNREIRPL